MSETSELSMITYDGGSVIFSPDVVATIAGIAALKVEGIAGMSGGITDGIVQILGFKNLKKGVKAEVNDMDTVLNLTVVVKYDVNIKSVCEEIQQSVKEAVETMTGLNVNAVNIVVQGVNVDEAKNTK